MANRTKAPRGIRLEYHLLKIAAFLPRRTSAQHSALRKDETSAPRAQPCYARYLGRHERRIGAICANQQHCRKRSYQWQDDWSHGNCDLQRYRRPQTKHCSFFPLLAFCRPFACGNLLCTVLLCPLDKRKSSGRKRSNHLSCRFLLRMVRGHDPRTSLHQLLKRTKAPLRNCAQHCT